jgi:hypothetical protein
VGYGPAGLTLASALGMFLVLSVTLVSPTNLSRVRSSRAVRSSLKMTVIDAGDLPKIHNCSMDANRSSHQMSSPTNDSCQFLKGVVELGNCLTPATV